MTSPCPDTPHNAATVQAWCPEVVHALVGASEFHGKHEKSGTAEVKDTTLTLESLEESGQARLYGLNTKHAAAIGSGSTGWLGRDTHRKSERVAQQGISWVGRQSMCS